MPIVATATSSKTFEIPDEGSHLAVLAQVKDLGEVEGYNQFTKKVEKVHKVMFRWEVEQRDEEGRRRAVFERFRLSLHEKAKLKARVKQIIGKEPGPTYDVETLVGANVTLVIEHKQGTKDPSKTYANVAAVLKAAKGAKTIPVVDPQAPAPTDNAPITDEDVPF